MQKNKLSELIVNALTRSIEFMSSIAYGDTKHLNFYNDYGYPENITFDMYYRMWKRNGYATAGVNHAIETCWQDFPYLVEQEKTHDKTAFELALIEGFNRLQFWSQLSEADKYSRVGEYSGVIFRFRDGKRFNEPVDMVAGGIDGIAEIIPAWQGQLKPVEYNDDETSENYGAVTMYQFNEAAVQSSTGETKRRQMMVHPDRVHIWSRNGSVHGTPVLEAGFNDLITIQKIIGAGGEGFWKNSKSAPILNVDKETKIANLAQMLNVPVDGIADKVDEIVGDFQTGLDKSMMFQGIDVKTLAVTLPIPDKFVLVAAQSFAASVNEPLKLLVGNQNGERASTEDNKQWNKTCNSRRSNYIKPNIMRIVERLVKFGILPDKPWYLLWSDLTESTTLEKMDVAGKMADMNQKLAGTGERAFEIDEIRETAGWDKSVVAVIPKRAPGQVER